MSIKKRCPECDALVTAPDADAGTTVECRKCGTDVKMPAVRRAAKAHDDEDRPRPRRRDRDEDEGGRPARSGKRGKKKGRKAKNPARILIVVAIVLFVLMAGGVIGTAAWYWSAEAAEGRTTINGETWYKADDPDGLFTAHFPGEKPKYEKFGFKPPAFLAKKAGKDADDLGWEVKSWTLKQDGREYTVSSMTLPSSGDVPPDLAARTVATTRVAPGPGVKVVVDDTVKYGAHDAKRICTQGGGEGKVALTIGVGRRQIVAITVFGRQDLDHTDPKVATFLENFKMLR